MIRIKLFSSIILKYFIFHVYVKHFELPLCMKCAVSYVTMSGRGSIDGKNL